MQTVTALIYWLIVALWLSVLLTVARAYTRNPRTFGVTRLLLIVVGIDTLRNIVENLYFGLYFGGQYGLFSSSIVGVLGSPYLLIIPKLINVLAACVVLALLLFRWLPLALEERKEAEESVRHKTSELTREVEERRRIIETALDAFMQIDREGRIVEWSSQAEVMFGLDRAAAVGSLLEDVIGLDDGYKSYLLRLIRDADSPGTRIQVDSSRAEAKVLKLELSISSFARGNEILFNIFARDLTDKIAAENELRQSQKMEAIGQLTGGVAHDFNNILTVITGNTEVLADEFSDRPDLKTIVSMIDEAAGRGADLTRHLLAFARKQPLQPTNLDINALVLEAEKLLRPTLGEHIVIKTALSCDAWSALADSAQLSSAILNLCLNARDAMPRGGTLTLETKNSVLDEEYARAQNEVCSGDYVQISVSDTGSGIDPEIIDSIFDPFFTTKRFGEGTGLGLSMVYGFVKQSRGHVRVHSELGSGTTFKLYLPRSRDQVSVAAKETKEPIGGVETILVVEDDALVRKSVVSQVEGLGYRTLVAANASEAMAALKASQIDLLFTDVIMPGEMNGRELGKTAQKQNPGLRVLYTSGYTENSVIHNGKLDAGVLLLVKPYRRTELARMLRLALGTSAK